MFCKRYLTSSGVMKSGEITSSPSTNSAVVRYISRGWIRSLLKCAWNATRSFPSLSVKKQWCPTPTRPPTRYSSGLRESLTHGPSGRSATAQPMPYSGEV